MKLLVSMVITLLCLALAQAQDKQQPSKTDSGFTIDFEYEKCGNPFVESQTYGWRFVSLKVVKIVEANSIIVEETTKNKKTERYKVNLIGIDPKENKANIKKFLLENLLNQAITISGNDMKFGAIVSFNLKGNKNLVELNRYLLEQGIAKFKDFESSNLVPYRTPCVYQKVEEKARQAKLGIWSNK